MKQHLRKYYKLKIIQFCTNRKSDVLAYLTYATSNNLMT